MDANPPNSVHIAPRSAPRSIVGDPALGEFEEGVVLVRGGDGDPHAVLAVGPHDDAAVGGALANSWARPGSGSQTKLACDGGTV